MDLRERIVAACDRGEQTREEIAEQFGVSQRSVYYLLARRRDSGSVAAKPHRGGFASRVDESAQQMIRDLVRVQPDATLLELCQRLAGRGGPSIRKSRMSQFLAKLGLARKKVASRL